MKDKEIAQMKNLQTSNTMIRNPRLNGYLKSPKIEKTSGINTTLKSQLDVNLISDNGLGSFDIGTIMLENKQTKCEQTNDESETKIPLPSIIGVSSDGKLTKAHVKKPRTKKSNKFGKHHETLQRIECINEDQHNHYQKHWFSAGLERLKIEDRSREERLEITRYELKRQLKQLIRCNVGKSAPLPQLFDWRDVIHRYPRMQLPSDHHQTERLVTPRICDSTNCMRHALPCARHCPLHIMNNPDQVLFNHCTAKFADNTQCSVPVFDILHEIPLCVEHARKRDNYKLYQDAKPKKIRKKAKPSAMIRPQKRTKKKKKPTTTSPPPPPIITTATTTTISLSTTISNGASIDTVASPTTPCLTNDVTSYMSDTIETIEVPNPSNILDSAEITDDLMTDVPPDTEDIGDDMVNQVLALQEPDALELATVDQVLVTQASHLLEETDITNVLNTIQADEFNDFFTVNRNGDYEPTREETEELERALAAVDNDVKSLEKLSQSQGLLDNFLDDHNLVESFVQSSIVSDVFHNGFNTCGENIMVGQASRLLSVQQNSHS